LREKLSEDRILVLTERTARDEAFALVNAERSCKGCSTQFPG
jgi:hypothetical protein